MKNQKLLLLLLTPFIVMACDLIGNEEDCSTISVLRQYNVYVDIYNNIDTTNCKETADALDSLIVFVEDNKNCVVSALEVADSTSNGNDLINQYISEWSTQKEKYSDCAQPTTFISDPCTEDSLNTIKDAYKFAYFDAYDAQDCQAITTALNNYITYLEDNKECITKVFTSSEIELEIVKFKSALKDIENSGCNNDIIEFYGLFKNRTTISDFNCNQAIVEFQKIEERYNTALSENNCYVLILYSDYLIEIYNTKPTCLIDILVEEKGYTAAEAQEKLDDKMNEIILKNQELKGDCN